MKDTPVQPKVFIHYILNGIEISEREAAKIGDRFPDKATIASLHYCADTEAQASKHDMHLYIYSKGSIERSHWYLSRIDYPARKGDK